MKDFDSNNSNNFLEGILFGAVLIILYQVYLFFKDYKEAIKYYGVCAISAEQENTAAWYNLGCIYENGSGVDINYLQALNYYKLSADKDNKDAQYNLKQLLKKSDVQQILLSEHFKMKEKIVQLEIENCELKYKPGGIGAKKAMKDFMFSVEKMTG